MLRENIENELRAIDHAAFGDLFDVALLRGREVAVENDECSFVRGGFGANFVELAAADECRGIGGVAHLMNRAGYVGSGAAGQFDEFVERLLAQLGEHVRGDALRALECYADQQNAFGSCSGLRSLHRSAWREHPFLRFRLWMPDFANLPSSAGLYAQAFDGASGATTSHIRARNCPIRWPQRLRDEFERPA